LGDYLKWAANVNVEVNSTGVQRRQIKEESPAWANKISLALGDSKG
jgi:hypothetical protein